MPVCPPSLVIIYFLGWRERDGRKVEYVATSSRFCLVLDFIILKLFENVADKS